MPSLRPFAPSPLGPFFGSLLLAVFVAIPAAAQDKGIADFPKLNAKTDWSWWRGPTRNGIAAAGPYPVKFTEAQAAWKVPVPARGHSSPTVVGDRIFLATADEKEKIQSVLAFSRKDGSLLWSQEINRGGFPAHNHHKNTEATATIACDGEVVVSVFYHHDKLELVALDLSGKIKWRKDAGPFHPKKYEYGYGSSPLIYRDSVIIPSEWEAGASYIAAFYLKNGEEKWRTPRPKNISFSSPVVGHVAGKDQLLLSGADLVCSYDPNTGKELWKVEGTTTATCGTMVWEGDVVFGSGGYPGQQTLAVKADGSGEVLWSNNVKCYEQSLIVVNGYVYGVAESGVLYCWNAKDGEEMWKQRLRGPESASPVYAGGHIYITNERGIMNVFKPNPEQYEEVAMNRFGNDFFATPSFCGGEIFLRYGVVEGDTRQEFLACIRGK